MAIKISTSINENKTALTIHADIGKDEIQNVYIYINDFNISLTHNLLNGGWDANNNLLATSATVPELFEGDILKEGIIVVVAQGASTENNSLAIEVSSVGIDYCLNRLLFEKDRTAPDFEESLNEIFEIFILIEGAERYASQGNLTETINTFELAKKLCSACGCSDIDYLSINPLTNSTTANTISGGVKSTSAIYLDGTGLLTRPEFEGKTLSEIKSKFNLFFQGTELLSLEGTTLKADGTIDFQYGYEGIAYLNHLI